MSFIVKCMVQCARQAEGTESVNESKISNENKAFAIDFDSLSQINMNNVVVNFVYKKWLFPLK